MNIQNTGNAPPFLTRYGLATDGWKGLHTKTIKAEVLTRKPFKPLFKDLLTY